MVPSKVNDVYFIRFTVCASSTEEKHIDFAWETIVRDAETIILKTNSI